MDAETNQVPKSTENPIDDVLARGTSLAEIAVAWSLGSTDNVRKLRIYNHTPSYATATLMAETFGWGSAGEVIDFWAARVAARKAEAVAS